MLLRLALGALLVMALLVTFRLALLARQSKSPRSAREPAADSATPLSPCPDRPNCVSSLDTEAPSRAVEPLVTGSADERVLDRLETAIGEMPGSSIVAREDGYLRAEFTSRIFGFVDDLELYRDPTTGVVHVRSASRTGHSDLGANRRRVEALRQRFERSADPEG